MDSKLVTCVQRVAMDEGVTPVGFGLFSPSSVMES